MELELPEIFCGVERILESDSSDTNTRSPTFTLVFDPQVIRCLSTGLNPNEPHIRYKIEETPISNIIVPPAIITRIDDKRDGILKQS